MFIVYDSFTFVYNKTNIVQLYKYNIISTSIRWTWLWRKISKFDYRHFKNVSKLVMDKYRLTIIYSIQNKGFPILPWKNSTIYSVIFCVFIIQCIMHFSTLMSLTYNGSSLDVNIELPVSNPESLDVCWVVWWYRWSNRTVFFRLDPLMVPILRQIAKWQHNVT